MTSKDSNFLKTSRIIGIIYVVTSILSMACQIFIFSIFYKKKSLLKNTAYKLILFLSILEFNQQIPQFTGGIFSIIESPIPIILERFLGSLLQGSFLLVILTTLFLTLNRFYIFYKSIIIKYINHLIVRNIAIFIIVSLGTSLFVTYSFHEYGLNYNITICSWNYIMDGDEPIAIYEFEYIFVLTILSICFIFYIFIFLRIIIVRSKSSHSSKLSFKSSDMRILIHILIIFLFSVIIEILWWYFVDWFNDSTLTNAILNYAWLVYSGMNSLINIIFISQLREEFIKIITCKCFLTCKESNSTPCKITKVTNVQVS